MVLIDPFRELFGNFATPSAKLVDTIRVTCVRVELRRTRGVVYYYYCVWKRW